MPAPRARRGGSPMETASSTPVRLLILTSATGGGHDARARACREWTERLYGCGVETRVEQILENSSGLLRFGVNFYNAVQRRAPCFHHAYWWLVEGFGWLQGRRLLWGRAYYRRLLEDFRPHIILSLHDSTNRGYFEEAKAVLGRDAVKCATYCGEFSGGYGYSRLWISPAADVFYSRNEEAEEYALRFGLNPGKCRVFCNLLPPKFFEEALTEEERGSFLRELGLVPEKFTLLLAAGGLGANHHLSYLEALAAEADRAQAVAVCGKNRRVFRQLQEWEKSHPGFGLHIEGYSRRMHRLLQAADAVAARGGANTAAEALFRQCPMIFDGRGGVMPQERLTIRYFVKRKAAAFIRSPAGLRATVRRWADNPEELKHIKKRLRKLRSQDSPEIFIRDIVEMAASAALIQPAP